MLFLLSQLTFFLTIEHKTKIKYIYTLGNVPRKNCQQSKMEKWKKIHGDFSLKGSYTDGPFRAVRDSWTARSVSLEGLDSYLLYDASGTVRVLLPKKHVLVLIDLRLVISCHQKLLWSVYGLERSVLVRGSLILEWICKFAEYATYGMLHTIFSIRYATYVPSSFLLHMICYISYVWYIKFNNRPDYFRGISRNSAKDKIYLFTCFLESTHCTMYFSLFYSWL